jgi:DNA-binding NarL/FixJ family response regulator
VPGRFNAFVSGGATLIGTAPIRVFVVTQHAALSQNLNLLLEAQGLVPCGRAGDGAGALRTMPTDTDVVVVGVFAGGPGAFELVRELSRRPGAPPVLVLSVHDDEAAIRGALEAGARGYLPNRKASELLGHAVREVASGRIWTPRPLASEQ